MLKNYLKVTFRNLVKQRFYSLINIIGLAIGLATCLLIVAYVLNELSYDRYHTKADRIYRSYLDFQMGGQQGEFAVSPAPMAGVFKDVYPEIEETVRFRTQGEYTVFYDDKPYKEVEVAFADSTLFNVFDIPLLLGDTATALTEVNSLIINATSAEKYFGSDWRNSNPLGKTLLLGSRKTPYQVTGVYEDFPTNSHIPFTMMLSMATRGESRSEEWLSNNFHTYFVLREHTDVAALDEKIQATFVSYAVPQLEKYTNASYEEFLEAGNYFHYYLQPLTDIHLYSDLDIELQANGDIRYVYIFSFIALFVLLIACFNFMNLATARSAGRAKEVCIRKALGSVRQQLIRQFLLEAVIISLLSLALALLLAEFALPYFNDLADKQIRLDYVGQWYYLPVALLVALSVGLLAGSYPAFFLSAFRPAVVLKGKLSGGAKSNWLRSTLVVLQFSISIMLIISTVVVFRQLDHIQQRKLGYDREHVLVLHNTYHLGEQIDAFKNELLRQPNIINAAISGYLPAQSFNSNSNAIFPDKNVQSDYTTTVPWWNIDYDYVPTLGMKIVEGRNFSRDFATDSTAMLVNQAAVKQFNLDKDGESPLGKVLSTFSGNGQEIMSFTVVGVVEDFNYETMRRRINPMVMLLCGVGQYGGRSTGAVSLRITPENINQTITAVEDQWNQFLPDLPFEYSFLDERFNNMYQSEQKVGDIFTLFCILAIFIACLGLFGLAAFMAEQRTKEIGIRKVLGASVISVVVMFSKDFTRLVLIALLIATPIAYFAMNEWLSDFAYRVPLGLGIFLVSGLAALVVAWLTVSFQSFKAAIVNPAKSLRSE
ncbi:MAG: ABC transporter permease [Cyclobacteriaceae bacterium]